ncbi:MAG: molybdopterin molybdenumtransferase MoeA, partial [Halovenus sp.]
MSHDHEDMLWRDEAVPIVRRLRERALDGRSSESVPLDAVAGRTLATDIIAESDSPPADYATMDGYAFDATGGYPYEIIDRETFPEDDPPSLGEGETVAIATGAPLPPEANAVVKKEEISVSDGRLEGPSVDPGTYTYEQGSNVREGEQLFAAGERLSPKDAIFLGDLGYETVDVTTRFSTGVLATGTEIHEGRSDDLDSAML